MRVYSLILEVTRRCNMCCAHCLRRDAEDIDMEKETVDEILNMVDEIQSVTFTGGEPSLNLPLIQYFFDKADEKGKFPEFFLAGHERKSKSGRARHTGAESVG